MQRVNTAEAKAHLSELLAAVEKKGEPIVIARHGWPVAALVALDDFRSLAAGVRTPRTRGCLSTRGVVVGRALR